MDVRDTFKAEEAVVRGWFRGLLIAHPFASVLIAFVAGIAAGAFILGVI